MLTFEHLKTQKQYNQLVKYLKPFGKYQLKLYIVTAIYIFLLGMLKTIFELDYPSVTTTSTIQLAHSFGLLITAFLSVRYSRKIILFMSTFFMLIAALILIFAGTNHLSEMVGLCCFGTVNYVPFTVSMSIVCQYLPAKYMSRLFVFTMLMGCAGKMILVLVLEAIQGDANLQIGLIFLLPIAAIQFILSFLVVQSPRYYLDNNVMKAEILIKKITKVNKCNEQLIQNRMGSNFVWKRINLQKYSWPMLFRYSSLNFPSYCYIVAFFCLGLLSKCPNFIIRLQTEFDADFNRIIQVKWVTGFQIIGILPLFIAVWACKRRYVIIIMTSISTIIVFCIYLLHVKVIFTEIPLLFDMALLGLNASASMTLYCFLHVSILQFYPHTIRVLGIGISMAAYSLGEFVEGMMGQFMNEEDGMMQMFLEVSLLMVIHSFGISETFNKGFNYQIKQLQDDENDQNLL